MSLICIYNLTKYVPFMNLYSVKIRRSPSDYVT